MGKTTVVGVDGLAMLSIARLFQAVTSLLTSPKCGQWHHVKYDGDPMKIQPVISARTLPRFCPAETHAWNSHCSSRVATNVLNFFVACAASRVVFPRPFDLHEVGRMVTYTSPPAINRDHAQDLGALPTDAQGDWWGGAGGGTVAHAAIASFLGDTAEAMMQFSGILPARIPRIALVDFNNDSVRDTLRVLDSMFVKYRELMDAGSQEEAEKYKLYGLRLDTSGSLRDVSVLPIGDPSLDLGVNPRLVFNVPQALDSASETGTCLRSQKEAAGVS